MGFESGNFNRQEVPPSREELRIYNEIQAALIGRSMSQGEDLDIHAQNWIDENSLNFSVVFDEMRIDNPNILEDWMNNREDVLSQIQDRMDRLANV